LAKDLPLEEVEGQHFGLTVTGCVALSYSNKVKDYLFAGHATYDGDIMRLSMKL
jgi:hypothetical protein